MRSSEQIVDRRPRSRVASTRRRSSRGREASVFTLLRWPVAGIRVRDRERRSGLRAGHELPRRAGRLDRGRASRRDPSRRHLVQRLDRAGPAERRPRVHRGRPTRSRRSRRRPTRCEVGEPSSWSGLPYGYGGTVSTGVVSAIRDRYVQFSAPVSPGSSGGPVLDADGRVIGVAAAKVEGPGAEGLSFAIPIWRVCQTDGGLLKGGSIMVCTNCGAEVRADNRSCVACGAVQDRDTGSDLDARGPAQGFGFPVVGATAGASDQLAVSAAAAPARTPVYERRSRWPSRHWSWRP